MGIQKERLSHRYYHRLVLLFFHICFLLTSFVIFLFLGLEMIVNDGEFGTSSTADHTDPIADNEVWVDEGWLASEYQVIFCHKNFFEIFDTWWWFLLAYLLRIRNSVTINTWF